ncbi:MAG: hypothetical protein IJG49_01980 [Erysipelotrichaceae bacterium]|nr:hypothetical protein [Erysipelotrichaceae bacterium]
MKQWYILLGGDISSDFHDLEVFFNEFTKSKQYKIADHTIFVPGNHELWSENDSCEAMIARLKELVTNQYGIIMLNNSLLLMGREYPYFDVDARYHNDIRIQELYNRYPLRDKNYYDEKVEIERIIHKELINEEKEYVKNKVIEYDELLSMTTEEIRQISLLYSDIIFGGIGFSGFNNEYNATNGIYRGTIKTIEEDIEQTEKFLEVYDILYEALSDTEVICFTHNPFSDWCLAAINQNWIYLNGHTHRHQDKNSNNKSIISDNQVGYEGNSFYLKYFTRKYDYNPFRYYQDGIYSISKWEYLCFNRFYGIFVNFNQENKYSIKMIKKKESYMFFAESKKTHKISILNGGKLIKAIQSIRYYYDNIEYFQMAIDEWISKIQLILNNLSAAIKKMGGYGQIHGLIVDIDFYNHIYLDLQDGTIKPYYATSMTHKVFYKSIKTLIKNRLPELYEKYLLVDKRNQLTKISNNDLGLYVSDTAMYADSRKMMSYQYALEKRIIRNWDENAVDTIKSMLLVNNHNDTSM